MVSADNGNLCFPILRQNVCRIKGYFRVITKQIYSQPVNQVITWSLMNQTYTNAIRLSYTALGLASIDSYN